MHAPAIDLQTPRSAHPARLRTLVVGLTAFLTLVDLFATQAILPSLARHYAVTPAAMGFAVNAATMGMAIAGLAVAFFSRRIDRRRGIVASLALLAVPTAALAAAPDLATFAALRVAQGLCMATAFALTLSHLAEQCSASDAAGAFAAYITGNVASNLFGRLMSAAAADYLGLAGNFHLFAGLNLAGAVLVWFSLSRTSPLPMDANERSPLSIWLEHVRNGALRTSFAIGFLILFAFIGTFTYVNFVLAGPPLALAPMALGLVYFVFAPSIPTTLAVGRIVSRLGTRAAFWGGTGIALAGLPLLVVPHLAAVLVGLALVAAGTFGAQAATTGFVGRAATADRGSASGLYLASYFLGGLVGAAVLGQLFDRFGWSACVAGVGVALALAALLGRRLVVPAPPA